MKWLKIFLYMIDILNNRCIDILSEGVQYQEKNCFKSAFLHIESAKKLTQIDPAMCAFRLITAEEEAASGLMYCLKRLSYPESDYLLPHNHQHKSALFPFISVLVEFLRGKAQAFTKELSFFIKKDDIDKKLLLQFKLKDELGGLYVSPVPPLNFTLKKTGGEEFDYSAEIDDFIKLSGARTIKEFVKREANYRNKILYANAVGLPDQPEMSASIINEREQRVIMILRIYMLFSPYSEHQPYVTHALKAFVALLKTVKNRSADNF